MDAAPSKQPSPQPEAGPINEEGSNKESIVQFWSIFRSLCRGYQQRIDALLLPSRDAAASLETPFKDWNDELKSQVRIHYATASKRNEGRLELDGIMAEVRSLQHRVLSSTSSFVDIDSNANNNEGLDELLFHSMPDLPQTDIRLITVEVEKILSRIDQARDVICPKEKFVFRRYRQALDDLDQNSADELATSLVDFHMDLEKQKEQDMGQQKQQQPSEVNFGGVVENKSNCIIEIQSDGSFIYFDDNDSQERWKTYTAPQPDEQYTATATGTTSYLLQNLNNSTLIIHPILQSLHIQNIHNCKIYSSVLGPVHVTNCHNSEIRCSAYQLRVHDSENVEFGVWVRSGPIIEKSTGIVFTGDFFKSNSNIGRNMYWDVKDFNWLRSLRKSPNFTVVGAGDKSSREAAAMMNVPQKVDVGDSAQAELGITNRTTVADYTEDSEDEL